jgi:hypothetical protein
MKRLMRYAAGLVFEVAGMATAWAGESTTNAWANNGWGRNSGTAGALANYDGGDGIGIARTGTRTGMVNLARGVAVGFDRDGLDFSFSSAIAPRFGPAYAGTFNLSIGFNGSVAGSYGGALSAGGNARSVEAGGTTLSGRGGATAQAHATGSALPWGVVKAQTDSYSQKAYWNRPARAAYAPRQWWR